MEEYYNIIYEELLEIMELVLEVLLYQVMSNIEDEKIKILL